MFNEESHLEPWVDPATIKVGDLLEVVREATARARARAWAPRPSPSSVRTSLSFHLNAKEAGEA